MRIQQRHNAYNLLIIGATIAGCTNSALLAIAAEDGTRAVDNARGALQMSVDELVSAKDSNENEAERETKKLNAAKETVKKALALGLSEIDVLEKKLKNLEIEKLVTDDYTFDAADVHDKLAADLTEGKSYQKLLLKNSDSAKTQDDIRRIAGELQKWRDDFYAPIVQKIFSIDIVLRQKTVVNMGNSRFEKILNDLHRLKNAKLITLEPFDAVLRQATANQKMALALHEEALQLLRTNLRSAKETIDNKRITNLVEQSFLQTKSMYKQFIAINKLMKGLLDNGTK